MPTPPAADTSSTVAPFWSTTYRLPAASNARPAGSWNPVAKVVAAPPPSGTLLTVSGVGDVEVAGGVERQAAEPDETGGEGGRAPPPAGTSLTVPSPSLAT